MFNSGGVKQVVTPHLTRLCYAASYHLCLIYNQQTYWGECKKLSGRVPTPLRRQVIPFMGERRDSIPRHPLFLREWRTNGLTNVMSLRTVSGLPESGIGFCFVFYCLEKQGTTLHS